MIEPLMYIGIGFLVAGLLVIGLIPMVHARAVRLTQRRLEALTPMSMAEIQADKDQLRAEFAMSTRRLEMSVEQMKARTTSQLAEIGKKSEAIGRLKLELSDKAAALLAVEAKEMILGDELAGTRQELAARSEALDKAERALAEVTAELGKTTGNLSESAATTETQRIELIALRAQVEVLKGQLESYEKETKDLRERLGEETTGRAATDQQLVDERSRIEIMGGRLIELERQLLDQTTETEILGRRVEELVSRLEEQTRFLAERDFAADQLRNEATAVQRAESSMRAEAEVLRSEKSLIEDQLKAAQAERDKLQRDLAAMKHETEKAWAAERMENAVLRERINDVAAEVARLTSVLEGPGSPIEAILAGDADRPRGNGNGVHGNGEKLLIAATGDGAKGTLADRIRALQNRTARAPQTS
jgi:chromosome segregation ATPase